MSGADRLGRADVGDGAQVAFEVYGADLPATPLLLIRPLGGPMALWGSFGAALAHTRPVVAYDPRGEGRSSKARLDETTRSLGRDAARVLDHLGIDVADVFGISLGGMTAEWLALDAPARVRRLCLASTTARGLDLLHAGARRGLGIAASFFAREDHVEAKLAESVLSRAFRRKNRARVIGIERPILAEPASRLELLKHTIAGARHDVVDRVGRIRSPTLVLAGDADGFLGLAPQRRLAAAIPGARFEIVAGAGHDLTLEKPLETAALVEAFLTT